MRRPILILEEVRCARCSLLGQYGCEASKSAHGGASHFWRAPHSLKALFVEGGPVSNTSVEEPDVDVVEVV